MRTLARAALWALLGFGLLLLAIEVSQRIPGSPVARSMRFVATALQQAPVPATGAAETALEATRWYEALALPALVGILEGLLIGFFRRPRALEAILSGLIFGLLTFVFAAGFPPRDLVSWCGPVLFLFSLIGGAYFVSDLRRPIAAPA